MNCACSPTTSTRTRSPVPPLWPWPFSSASEPVASSRGWPCLSAAWRDFHGEAGAGSRSAAAGDWVRRSVAAWRTELANLLAARGDHRPALDHLQHAIDTGTMASTGSRWHSLICRPGTTLRRKQHYVGQRGRKSTATQHCISRSARCLHARDDGKKHSRPMSRQS